MLHNGVVTLPLTCHVAQPFFVTIHSVMFQYCIGIDQCRLSSYDYQKAVSFQKRLLKIYTNKNLDLYLFGWGV